VRMLHSVRAVYERQREILEGDPVATAAWDKGLRQLTDIFLDCVVENVQDRLRAGDTSGAAQYAAFLAAHSPERAQAINHLPSIQQPTRNRLPHQLADGRST
jgi:hypothetical protein